MILILSEQNDVTTDIVCSWLNHYNCKFIRINEEEAHNPDVKIRINDGKFTVLYSSNSQDYDLSNVEICWYRRGFLYFHIEEWLPNVGDSTNESISKFLDNEGSTLKNFFYRFFGSMLSINHPDNYNCNKLIALYEATKVGFKIPNSLISRHSTDLRSFIGRSASSGARG